MTDESRVPAEKITVNNIEKPEEGTKPENVKDTGVQLPVEKEKPDEKKPSVTIDLTKVPETIREVVVGKNVKTAVIVVEKPDGSTATKEFPGLDKNPSIVVEDLSPKDQELFKDAKKITIIPKEPTKPDEPSFVLTVKIHVCGEFQ